MYTSNLSVSDYTERFYQVEINASWITIYDSKTGSRLYRRAADFGPWYDDSHRAIINALNTLESAVFSAVDSEPKS